MSHLKSELEAALLELSEVVLMIAMEKDFRASKTLQGLAITASTVIEVPVFYYSDSLLKSYSVSKMFLVAHSTMAFRLLAKKKSVFF